MNDSSTSAKKRGPRRVGMQVDGLVKYMTENQLFARGEFEGPNGKRKLDSKWVELTSILNELGPFKSEDQWRKLWRNLKADARKKNAMWSKWHAQTGNKTNNTAPSEPTDKERLILSIIGEETSVGLGVGEAGFGPALAREDDHVHFADDEDNITVCNMVEINCGTPSPQYEISQDLFENEPIVISVPSTSMDTNDPKLSQKRVMNDDDSSVSKKKKIEKQPQVEQYVELAKTTNIHLEDINHTLAGINRTIEEQFNRLNRNIELLIQCFQQKK